MDAETLKKFQEGLKEAHERIEKKEINEIKKIWKRCQFAEECYQRQSKIVLFFWILYKKITKTLFVYNLLRGRIRINRSMFKRHTYYKNSEWANDRLYCIDRDLSAKNPWDVDYPGIVCMLGWLAEGLNKECAKTNIDKNFELMFDLIALKSRCPFDFSKLDKNEKIHYKFLTHRTVLFGLECKKYIPSGEFYKDDN